MAVVSAPRGFVPPPYPYDRLERFYPLADAHEGGAVDLSIGTPFDPPPPAVIEALAGSGTERSYPPSVGSAALRTAASEWIRRRFDVEIGSDHVAVSVGSKEFVAGLPQLMRLRTPDRDTVLSPAVAYPSYAMGATLGGCRSVTIPPRPDGTLDLDAVDPADAERALLLWVNSPSNPTGALDDLGAAAAWGRAHGVPVFSDECYAEFTWSDRPRTVLEHGFDGVVAVHSLSKRSNLAGVRVGFYAGDPDLVEYLGLVRKHAGLMVPGPAQAAGVAALDDDEHVVQQRRHYRQRLELLAAVLAEWSGQEIPLPAGGFYLWIPVDDGWTFTERLARDGGAIVSPGEFYGDDLDTYVRIAVVQPDHRIELVAERLRERGG